MPAALKLRPVLICLKIGRCSISPLLLVLSSRTVPALFFTPICTAASMGGSGIKAGVMAPLHHPPGSTPGCWQSPSLNLQILSTGYPEHDSSLIPAQLHQHETGLTAQQKALGICPHSSILSRPPVIWARVLFLLADVPSPSSFSSEFFHFFLGPSENIGPGFFCSCWVSAPWSC